MTYKDLMVTGLRIAYREAGNLANPELMLLYGFPASSHQSCNLIRSLADRFHVIASDYPGLGDNEMPDPMKYGYSFDKISEVVQSFLQDQGFDHFGCTSRTTGVRLS
jgi:pimeloyl-ACP methyl ester carboxylesterase